MSNTPEQERIAELEIALLPFARYVLALKLALGVHYRPPMLAGGVARIEAADWDRAAEAMLGREEQ